MDLDYSLPASSRYILFLDAPFRYSWRHLIQYFNSRIIDKRARIQLITEKERMMHFLLAFLEVLPLLGILVAICDRLLFYKKRAIVTQYGEQERVGVMFMVEKIVPLYSKVFGSDAKKEASLQEAYILPRYIQEMKAIAEKYHVPYGNILLANTILDRVNLFGGEIVTENIKPSLLKDNKRDTIASCVYDEKNKCLLYAFGSDYAANRAHKTLPLEWLHAPSIGQNITTPMGLLAPCTRLFIHKKTAHTYAYVSISWLGMIGTYSGINEHGLVVTATNVLSASKTGTPCHLLIRQLLEEAKTIEEAKRLLTKSEPASSMNLLIAKDNHTQQIPIG